VHDDEALLPGDGIARRNTLKQDTDGWVRCVGPLNGTFPVRRSAVIGFAGHLRNGCSGKPRGDGAEAQTKGDRA
jgi:hypothetical protein